MFNIFKKKGGVEALQSKDKNAILDKNPSIESETNAVNIKDGSIQENIKTSTETEVKFPETKRDINLNEVPSPYVSQQPVAPPPKTVPRLKTIVQFEPLEEPEQEETQTKKEKFIQLSEYNLMNSEIIVMANEIKAKREEVNEILLLKNNYDEKFQTLLKTLEDCHRKTSLINKIFFNEL